MTSYGAPSPLVGVVGGLGPMATAYFLERIVAMTDADRDQDHLDLVVLNHSSVPDRTAFLIGRSDDDPAPILAADAHRLEVFGAEFLVMPCNTAHRFTLAIREAITIPLVSIIDVTVAAAMDAAPDADAFGLLATEGTIAARVYHDAFEARGRHLLTPDHADQQAINSLIYDQVKAGLPSSPDVITDAAQRLVDRGAAEVILGCTELSVAAVDHGLLANPLFTDSLDQLVRATITAAGRKVLVAP